MPYCTLCGFFAPFFENMIDILKKFDIYIFGYIIHANFRYVK